MDEFDTIEDADIFLRHAKERYNDVFVVKKPDNKTYKY